MENKRIFYVLILIVMTMFGTSCAKEHTLINTEYKDLEIHKDCVINEIGTVGNAYYYSYYNDDKSRCQICRFDLISNELSEIRAFDSKQLDRIIIIENGLVIKLTTDEIYIINSEGECMYMCNNEVQPENSVNDGVLMVNDECIYVADSHRIINRNLENGNEKVFLDLEDYVIFYNRKCYNSDKYFVIEASSKDTGRPVVVIYEYSTKELVLIENRKLIGRSQGNEYILMQNPNPVNEKESECIYVFSVDRNEEIPVIAGASDINNSIYVSQDGKRLFGYKMHEEDKTATIFCYDIVSGKYEEIDCISQCYEIWSVALNNRAIYFLTGQKEGYVLEKYQY